MIGVVRDPFKRRLDGAHSWMNQGAEVKPYSLSNTTGVEQRRHILLLPVDLEWLAALNLQIIDHF